MSRDVIIGQNFLNIYIPTKNLFDWIPGTKVMRIRRKDLEHEKAMDTTSISIQL
jgi:hypothetical protein